MKERWPASPAENLERLKNAGLPMDRGVPKCSRCEEMGHMARQCPQEESLNIIERVEVKCANCKSASISLLLIANQVQVVKVVIVFATVQTNVLSASLVLHVNARFAVVLNTSPKIVNNVKS